MMRQSDPLKARKPTDDRVKSRTRGETRTRGRKVVGGTWFRGQTTRGCGLWRRRRPQYCSGGACISFVVLCGPSQALVLARSPPAPADSGTGCCSSAPTCSPLPRSPCSVCTSLQVRPLRSLLACALADVGGTRTHLIALCICGGEAFVASAKLFWRPGFCGCLWI